MGADGGIRWVCGSRKDKGTFVCPCRKSETRYVDSSRYTCPKCQSEYLFTSKFHWKVTKYTLKCKTGIDKMIEIKNELYKLMSVSVLREFFGMSDEDKEDMLDLILEVARENKKEVS